MKTASRRLWLGAMACLATGMAGAAAAQGYPSKMIRIVIAYPMGGGSDFTARPIAQKLTERWGQSAIVDSRPGAAAMIGKIGRAHV